MYHVRFLKAPSLSYSNGQLEKAKKVKKLKIVKPAAAAAADLKTFSLVKQVSSSHIANFHSVVTISNDLGELFFYGNLKLKCSIYLGTCKDTSPPILDMNLSLNLVEDEFSWSLGARSLAVTISVPVAKIAHIMNKQHTKVFAIMKIEVVSPDTVIDELGTTLEDAIKNSQEQFKNAVSPDLDTVLQSKSFQFLNVMSLPFEIPCTYEISSRNLITAERYCIRSLATSNDIYISHHNDYKYQYSILELLIVEELGNGIARHLWNAGVHTMNILPLILEQLKELPRNSNILELGTGVGIISIALSKIVRDATIWATDLSDAEEICEQNIKLNNSNAKFGILEWETKDKSDLVSNDWDSIIITDCTYNPSYYDALINVIERESSKNTIVLLAHKIRESEGETTFFTKFKNQFEPLHEIWIHNLHESIHIGRYKKKIKELRKDCSSITV